VRPPIVVSDGHDLLVFESVESATGWVEPYDVDEGTAFDADGRLVAFELDGPGRLWEKTVVLREREAEPTHETELREAITAALLAVGAVPDPSAPLAQLVGTALRRFRVA
jgi:hypothetical protein